MNWYKRLLNRLFGNNIDTGETDHTSEFEDAKADVEMQYDSTDRPIFRFPIISDAEIYGWDESEPISTREVGKTNFQETEENKKEFEPTPLFENDRWPDRDTEVRIFRAGDGSKYPKYSEPRQDNYLTEKAVRDTEFTIRQKGPIQKRSNRAFTPTNVPSPIYGFSSPKNEDFQEIDVEEDRSQIDEIVVEAFAIEQNKVVTPIKDKENVQTDLDNQNSKFTLSEIIPIENSDDSSASSDKQPDVKKEKTVPVNGAMMNFEMEKTVPIEQKPIPEITQTELKEMAEGEESHYAFPSYDYLIRPEAQSEDTEWVESQSSRLVEALSHFAVKAKIVEAVQGPTVTRFELTVGQGTKVSKIRNLTDDLKLALAAEDIRIQAPIPGKSSIGIEIPNQKTRPVRISEVISTKEFRSSDSPLEAVLGLSLTGTPVTIDLRKMPHGMIAGATGSGKSVCINSLLVSLLYKATPSDLKMMLIDPKMVELAPFNGIPHLISPVITDVKAATAALKWAVAEMERRYESLAHAGVRDIERYNKSAVESGNHSLKMPYLLIVIDELADLMMMAPADVEVSISRIAQKARACGIHLIIATQRPSVDVITGTIKANIPTRIAFSVSSQIDSRTILDVQGAERLLGKGDMLYIGNGQSAAVRLQGTFVTDDEIERIIEHVRREATPNYLFGQDDLLANAIEEEESDPLFEEACLFVYEQDSASTSQLQRNFSIGYNRAAKLIDRMEEKGFISGQKGSKARDVFITEKEIDQLTEPLGRNV